MTRRALALCLASAFVASPATALEPREGWVVTPTQKSYEALLSDLRAAVRSAGMGLVTDVGPTEVAKSRGETVPGNRVIGVFRNDFAVRALRASEAAMIEAPIRFYVTEGPDGLATLSYKTPSFVFAPYLDGAAADLAAVASDLDAIFAAISADAAK